MSRPRYLNRRSFDRLRYSKMFLGLLSSLQESTSLSSDQEVFEEIARTSFEQVGINRDALLGAVTPISTLDNTHTTSGDVAFDDNGALVGFSSRITDSGIISSQISNLWIVSLSENEPDGTLGTYRFRLLNPTFAPLGTRQRNGQQTWKIGDTGTSTDVNLVTGSTYGPHRLFDYQAIDMTAILAREFDVHVGFGQSNLVTGDSDGSTYEDGLRDPTIFYSPGTSYNQYGVVQDEFTLMTPPLQFGSWNGSAIVNAVNLGASPAIEYMRKVRQATDPSRNVLFIATAVSSSNSLASDAPWNPSGSNPVAYNAMLSRVAAIMAQLPSGSEIKSVLASFGEGDTSADMSAWPAKINEIRTSAETAWQSAGYKAAGDLPWIWINAPVNATRSNQDELVRVTRLMDTNSGDPASINNLHVVERPPVNDMVDSTHVSSKFQRIAGKLAGHKYVEIIS